LPEPCGFVLSRAQSGLLSAGLRPMGGRHTGCVQASSNRAHQATVLPQMYPHQTQATARVPARKRCPACRMPPHTYPDLMRTPEAFNPIAGSAACVPPADCVPPYNWRHAIAACHRVRVSFCCSYCPGGITAPSDRCPKTLPAPAPHVARCSRRLQRTASDAQHSA